MWGSYSCFVAEKTRLKEIRVVYAYVSRWICSSMLQIDAIQCCAASSIAIRGMMLCLNLDHPLLLPDQSLCLATPKHGCLSAKYCMAVFHMTCSGSL